MFQSRRSLMFIQRSRVLLCQRFIRDSKDITFKLMQCRMQPRHKLQHTLASTVEEHPVTASKTNIYSIRSCTCGELKLSDVDRTVILCGWLQYERANMFLILRDAYGQVQVIIPHDRKDLKGILEKLPLESVLLVEGTVMKRPEDQIKKNSPTGEIEVNASNITVLNKADPNIPFHIRNYSKAKEDLRLKYRYLDFRFPVMQHNLRFRSNFLMKAREFLINHRDFVEVETPTLFKRTPGGAREFVVPTHQKDQFYSLVQSPQQLKQLLMVGGLDRYFQVARCYRDESTRPDRQPEFTQLDIELSFTTRESVISLIEHLLCFALNIPMRPFPQMKYKEAVSCYGSDKPDLRYDCKIKNINKFLPNGNTTTSPDDVAYRILTLPHASGKVTNKVIKEYKNLAKKLSKDAKISAVKAVESEALAKIVPGLNVGEFRKEENLNDDDVIIISWGSEQDVLSLLGQVRADLHKTEMAVLNQQPLDFADPNSFSIFWIVDFPLFVGGADGVMESAHHPFTQPHPEDQHLLLTKTLEVRGLHYDLVLNGNEIGGGSIRIHNSELQETVLRLLNIEPSSLQHMIEAFKYGCPPHGGIALGIDRLMSILCRTETIRDVIAFPKGFGGKDHLSGAPCDITDQEKQYYHLR